MATLDHLFHKFDRRRSEPNTTNEQRWVMACNKCNVERGNADAKAATRVDILNYRMLRKARRAEQEAIGNGRLVNRHRFKAAKERAVMESE